jgi:carbon-monoxide dehydrogenase medium subunit
VSIDDFFIGYRSTVLAPAEVITGVRIPIGGPGTGSAFIKLGRRAAMEISVASVGVRLEIADDGTVARAGIGLGSVAPTTVRAARAEALLEGADPTPEKLAEAADTACEACDPIDDVRATAGYRRAVVPTLVGRALQSAVDRIERMR